MPDELWTEVRDLVQETGIKTIPMEKECKKAKWLSGEALQIAVKRRVTVGLAIPFLGIHSRYENICPCKNLYTNAKSSIICSNQGVEATQISISDEWINRMWYIHLTEYYSDIKRSEVPLIAQGELLSTLWWPIWERIQRRVDLCIYVRQKLTQHCKSAVGAQSLSCVPALWPHEL